MQPLIVSARTPLAAVLVYAAAFVVGLALVSFPASSAVLKLTLGLDDAQYGSIFLPQVALALIGALGGGALAARFGLLRLLVVSVLALAASQLALLSALWLPQASYLLVLCGTGLLGFGFGLGGAPLNGYAAELFPQRRNTALVALHSLVGLGLAAGPLLIGALPAARWSIYPGGLLATACLLAMAAGRFMPVSSPAPAATAASAPTAPLRRAAFWLFAATAVLYAFAEGVFANWAVVYVSEARQLPLAIATLALSMFWAALVAGRLLVSALLLRVPAHVPWLALPLLMIAAFWYLAQVENAAQAIAAFAFAGFACSAFFPLTIALVSERFPHAVAQTSSLLIAALMLGVGLGSFLIGGLRASLALETLYLYAIAFPLAALVLGGFALRAPRSPAAAQAELA